MAQQNRTTLKTYFQTGDLPTEAQFADFVDSCFNPSDDTLDAIPDGTTYKLFLATERTKLAGIETGADVTDTANVTAAGALMDSEVANLAQVKAFNSSDYATAAQGAKADTAYQPAGTDVAVADGGTGASTAASARVNLGVMNIVVLSSDVVADDAVANTIEDVTGLSFSVTAGETYYFRFTFDYTANATTTGARFSVNGPAATRLAYRSIPTLTTTSQSINQGLTSYDLPAAANASTASTAGNIAVVEGFVTPSANGTVIGRVASEVSSAAITVKAGSILEWYRCL